MLVQVDAVAPGHLHRREELRSLEARSVDNHVDLVLDAVGGDDARGRDLPNRLGDQLHVVAFQRARPHAVVAQKPLRARRVARHDLSEEVGPVGELGAQVSGQQLTQDVVEETDRESLRLVVGVDAHTRQHAYEAAALVDVEYQVLAPFTDAETAKSDIAELKSELKSDMHSLRADVAADFIAVRKEFGEQIVGLRRAVIEYHTSVIGHGIIISDLEARVRRVEQHLNLPSLEPH